MNSASAGTVFPELIHFIHHVLNRPGMYGYFQETTTLKEMLMFIEGACWGRTTAYSQSCSSYRGIGDFDKYVREKFNRGPKEHWTKIIGRTRGIAVFRCS
jgi:hypothetical protein